MMQTVRCVVVLLALASFDVAVACEPPIDLHRAWHGRLMALAWSVLIPIGVLMARYCKVTPRQPWPEVLDNPAWWHAHRATQYVAVACMVIAIYLILNAPPDPTRTSNVHGVVGWCAFALAIAQLIGAWLRGSKGGPSEAAPDGSWFGDHYNMTSRRQRFESIHKTVGYLLLMLAAIATVSGLATAAAPVWMRITITLWWLALMIVEFLFIERGRSTSLQE